MRVMEYCAHQGLRRSWNTAVQTHSLGSTAASIADLYSQSGEGTKLLEKACTQTPQTLFPFKVLHVVQHKGQGIFPRRRLVCVSETNLTRLWPVGFDSEYGSQPRDDGQCHSYGQLSILS